MELMIGKVIKSHGIKGEVSVEVLTDEPDIRFAKGAVLNGRQGRKEHSLTIQTRRMHQGRMLIKFAEVPDRTVADTLRGTQFWAPPLDKEDDDDSFYDHELIGLRIIHDEADIGVVTGVIHGAASNLLEVRLEATEQQQEKDVLIPFVHAIVPEVDVESGTCTITPPDGLLEL
ncbi:ribosome maturation factor RimM [Corynebacterium sp. sy017]|uniref:ribosome maturation factor RimM n=1 Tax=unclassified Corynebacterium TaxID=2624378 RepID=UPI001185E61C|nr:MULTISPECIES: ribosome maturation factor RimM [unclassified Corynebacterium]MBP3087870.1 ribosome maturation factor RimM [Corynebacterium sp. sy017]QDZ42838.1 ribosome maturation factor RimM [Corynebacterium sp. sy039]TSD92411.1 ribosome maturation factor RimM [Corynebacterium sp. SY003]